jgi:tRNA wybutosine-synthesizing protein 3
MEMRGMSGELLGTIGHSPPSKPQPKNTDAPSTNPEPVDPTPRPPNLQPAKPPLPTSSTPPLLPAFLLKKSRILTSLHPPSQPYTDASPKGSIDAQIIDLIDEINAYPGLVTTSSCAGRVSVFCEGRKKVIEDGDREGEREKEGSGNEEGDRKERIVPGGKGLGGKWLFVSHEPPNQEYQLSQGKGTWSEVFSLLPLDPNYSIPTTPRLIKFAFEPLILHILSASLSHAAPLLSAAVNAGFRESGVSSLKLKEGGEGVMVGIRSAGLGLESVIGVLEENGDGERGRAVVGEGVLELLVRVAGERFKANEERRERFRRELREQMGREGGGKKGEGWEDKDERARRKRAEGLRRKEELRRGERQEQGQS